MEAGKLDRQIVIEQATVTNVAGDVTESWTTFATVWAQVEGFVKGESWAANATLSSQASLFRIRYLSGLNQKMRILYNSEPYYIRAITFKGRDEIMEVVAEGGVD